MLRKNFISSGQRALQAFMNWQMEKTNAPENNCTSEIKNQNNFFNIVKIENIFLFILFFIHFEKNDFRPGEKTGKDCHHTRRQNSAFLRHHGSLWRRCFLFCQKISRCTMPRTRIPSRAPLIAGRTKAVKRGPAETRMASPTGSRVLMVKPAMRLRSSAVKV